jgi:hypothetical protein
VKAFVNGYDVDISHNIVYIYDPEKKLGDNGAVVILRYLKSEGFLMYDEVYVQIVSKDGDSHWGGADND